MTTTKALELVLELAEGNMLEPERTTDPDLLREARKQERAHKKVSALLAVLRHEERKYPN